MVEFDSRIGETSSDLQSRFDAQDTARANDTSVCTGYAPLSETDRIINGLEPELRERISAIGEDIKLMGWRTDNELRITVAAAVISRYVSDISEYVEVKERIADTVTQYANKHTERTVHVDVNATDDIDTETVYLTKTGLSAEMGDDGNVGRGNRVNGVITPHRSMSLEASAGKNPVSHVGKLYNLVATNAAERIHRELGAEHAELKILTQIGQPVARPLVVDVDTTVHEDDEVRHIVTDELNDVESLTRNLVDGEPTVF